MSNRYPQAWRDPRPTAWKELGFMHFGPSHWRLVDLVQTAYNNSGPNHMNTPSVVGRVYRTRLELLGDLPRYAADFGATPL